MLICKLTIFQCKFNNLHHAFYESLFFIKCSWQKKIGPGKKSDHLWPCETAHQKIHFYFYLNARYRFLQAAFRNKYYCQYIHITNSYDSPYLNSFLNLSVFRFLENVFKSIIKSQSAASLCTSGIIRVNRS